MLAFGWTGFLAGDDGLYAAAAQRWLAEGPHPSQSFGALRHTVVLPIAISFAVFGVNEYALVLPTLVYFASLLAVTYACVRATLGRSAALAASVLLATTPLFPLTATLASADIAELFFVATSLWALLLAGGSRGGAWALVAGAAAGLAFLTRETSAALLLSLGVLLRDRRPTRRLALEVAAAFAFVVAIELAYLTAMNGDPFHKIRLSFLGQQRIPATGSGNVEINPYVDPLLALLLNQEFALLFYFALPAGVWMSFGTRVPEPVRDIARSFGGLGLVWFFSVALSPFLRPLPRYFSVSAYAAVIVIAAWVVSVLRPRSLRLCASVVAVLVLSNLLGVYVDNRDFLFGARALVRAAAAASETVYTDPETAQAATFLLAEAELSGRVAGAPPPPGSLYFHDPKRVAHGVGGSFDPALYTPRDTWTTVLRVDPGRKLGGRIAEWLGLDRLIPDSIFAKLDHPNLPVALYRVASPPQRTRLDTSWEHARIASRFRAPSFANLVRECSTVPNRRVVSACRSVESPE